MDLNSIQYREALSADRNSILAVHRDAFGDEDGPVIEDLLVHMLDDPTAEPIYSFVAEIKESILGHVLFTSVKIEPHQDTTAQILAPLAVAKNVQGQAIGTRLVTNALQKLSQEGVDLVFVLGYPSYYTRFGFQPAGVHGFQAPYHIAAENADAWMVLELKAGAIERCPGRIECCDSLNHEQYWME